MHHALNHTSHLAASYKPSPIGLVIPRSRAGSERLHPLGCTGREQGEGWEGRSQFPTLCLCTASLLSWDFGVAVSALYNTGAAEQNHCPNLPLSVSKTLMSILTSPKSPLVTLQCSASGVPQAFLLCFGISGVLWFVC